MLSHEELMQRARSDLAKAESAEARAREALDRALEDKVRIKGFIETLERYLGAGDDISATRNVQRGSRSRELVDKAMELIFFNERPIEIGELADLIEAEGLKIAGQNRNATLAGYLSRDDRVEFVRGIGWQLTPEGQRLMTGSSSRNGRHRQDTPIRDLDDDIPF